MATYISQGLLRPEEGVRDGRVRVPAPGGHVRPGIGPSSARPQLEYFYGARALGLTQDGAAGFNTTGVFVGNECPGVPRRASSWPTNPPSRKRAVSWKEWARRWPDPLAALTKSLTSQCHVSLEK